MIPEIKKRKLNKSKKINFILEFLYNKYGDTNILIKDYWDADKEAIGLTDKTGRYLAYISTYRKKDNTCSLRLENPPVNNEELYSSAGGFDDISLDKFENILAKHLRLTK